MGIRDISYHSKIELFRYNSTSVNHTGKVLLDSSGTFYLLDTTISGSARKPLFVKSIDGRSFQSIDAQLTAAFTGTSFRGDFAINSQDQIYFLGADSWNYFVYRSSDKGTNWEAIDSGRVTTGSNGLVAYGLTFSGNNVYYLAYSSSFVIPGVALRYSSTGNSGTFSTIDFLSGNGAAGSNTKCILHSDGKIYWTGVSGTSAFCIRSGTISGTFGFVMNEKGNQFEFVGGDLTTDFSGALYVGLRSASINTLYKSATGLANTFVKICSGDLTPAIGLKFYDNKNLIYGINVGSSYDGGNLVYTSLLATSSYTETSNVSGLGSVYDILVDRLREKIYVIALGGDVTRKIYQINLQTNSSSLGPLTFAPSFGWNTGLLGREQMSLANVSEFPHAAGIFQMKNIILGTIDSGKIGNKDDSIIKINHIGSTVKIMWPKQSTSNDSMVRGYGDLSIGQSVGKLTNVFEPGDFFDVTEFDHMALYCYLIKQASGTLDDVVIQVERKPLTNIGFTTEQAISYSTSGSIAEGRLRDLQYPKEIDYGDLSVREIGYPIDIPLTNVKQVRISAKHKNGQTSDLNKNFIVYGRFIKSDKNKIET